MLTVGTVIVSCALFYGLVALLRRTGLTETQRRGATILIWIAIATVICWLLFERDDAAAAVIHQRNVGMAVMYFYIWLLAVLVSPLIVFTFSRLAPWKGR